MSLYRGRFPVFLGISAILTGAMLAIASLAFVFIAWFGSNLRGSSARVESSVIAGIFAVTAATLALPLFLGVTALALAAMTHAANRAWSGEKTTIRESYKPLTPDP